MLRKEHSSPASRGWPLAFAAGASATLVTFDRALHDHARKSGHAAATPA